MPNGQQQPLSRHSDNKWVVLALLALAQFMVVLDVAIVNVAHELPVSALIMVTPRPAVAITTTKKIAIVAATPDNPLISLRAMSAKERPSLRTEANRMMKSCTAPPTTAPMMIQSVPGKYPNCAASTGPTSGPGPAMAAK